MQSGKYDENAQNENGTSSSVRHSVALEVKSTGTKYDDYYYYYYDDYDTIGMSVKLN